MPASEPQQLGDFEVLGKIGQGAMGTVYRARQTSLGRIVALKLLPAHYASDADFLARFKNEASAAAALNHSNIVQVYAAGEDDGSHFFAMEYVEGESLGSRMERKGRIDAREAIAVACYLAQALDYAWKKAQVIHRDIKPDNIFLSSEGTVKLGDLGLAKVLGNQANGLTQTGTAMGTPYYVSPEQAMGLREIDFRADIYSLGCTIYHAMTGETPYQGEGAMAVMLQHVSQPAPKIQAVWPECPPPIIGLLDRMLRKKPEERHESYEALLQQLFWVAERLDQPTPSAVAAMSMVVPMPLPRSGSTPDASRKSAPAARSISPVPVPAKPGGWKIAAIIAATAVALFVWQPWNKYPTPATEGGVKMTAAGSNAPVATDLKASTAADSKAPDAADSKAPTAAEVKVPAVEMPAPPGPTTAPVAVSPVAGTAPEGFRAIFNGKDLTGWHGFQPHLAEKTEGQARVTLLNQQRTEFPKYWRVENGEMVNAGEGPYATTDEEFGDIELLAEYRTVARADSGIYLRGCPQVQIWDYTDPAKFSVGSNKGSGGLYNNAPTSAGRFPLVLADKPFGQWNAFRIRQVGARTSVWLNEKLVVDGAMMENYPDRTTPLPSKGPILLQTHGGEIRWRNIYVRTQVNDDDGFVSLFETTDSSDWKQFGPHGVTFTGGSALTWVSGRQGSGCWWYTRKQYGDFLMKLEFRIETPDANSGVFVRFDNPDQTRKQADTTGYQIDVSEEPNPLEKTGAICFTQAPTSVPQKARDWNELEIEAVGQRYLVKLNGTLVNDFTGNRLTSGYIGFQSCKVGGVRYRNVRIKPITTSILSAPPTPKPQSETEKWIVQMDATYQPIYLRDVANPYESALASLNKNYLSSIDRESASATRAAKLNDALAFRNERQRIETGSGVPSDDSDMPPAALKPLRAAYRAQFARLEADRRKRATTVFDQYDKVLAANQNLLTQRQRLDDALALQKRRETLAKEWMSPMPATAAGNAQTKPAKSEPTVAQNNSIAEVSLFNGKDLTGWDGDRKLWSVKDAAITAESPGNGRVTKNTYLIWKGGTVSDFELRLSFKITTGNSGIQYRSRLVEPATWRVFGYQYEMDAAKWDTNGGLYDEGGQRKGLGGNPGGLFMAKVGEKVRMAPNDEKQVLGALNAPRFNSGDWNQLVITAQGNHLTHQLNGVVAIDLTDEDARASAASGVLALQLHAGPPQLVQFKDIFLKLLPKAP